MRTHVYPREVRGRIVRGHKCPRWGAKRQAATCVAEELERKYLGPRRRVFGVSPPSEGIHALAQHALAYHALVICALAVLLSFCAPAHAEKNLVRPPGTTRYGVMVRELNALLRYDKSHEKRMALSSLGRSVRGRKLWMVTLGSGPKRIFYLCRQHGHEPASTEGALAFINKLVTANADLPIASCLKAVTVSIVPMANPDGSEAFLRHNARDADINRDWITRTQPETKLLYTVISKVHPDLLADQHELYPDDTRPDFTEVAANGSGASASVIAACEDAQAVVTGAMSAEGFPVVNRTVTDMHPARLAHRFAAIKLGIPTVLFETNRLAGTGRIVVSRASAHEVFMETLLRYLGGDRDVLVSEAAGHPALPVPTEQKGTD